MSAQTASAVVDYLLTRIRADVQFLSSQGLLDAHDRDAILQRVDGAASRAAKTHSASPTAIAQSGAVASLTQQFGQSSVTDNSNQAPPPPLPALSPAGSHAPPATQERARALWAYSGSQPDDLTFNKGDVILIISKENDHWWRGSVMGDSSGRQGLFPSNHVETFGQVASPGSQTTSYGQQHQAPPYQSHSSSYYGASSGGSINDPEKAALQPYQPHPPPANQYYQPPPPPQPYYQQQSLQPPQTVGPPAPSPSDPEKKNKFKLPGKGSGLGNTLAHSFVGGAGFGAGSAAASEIIHSIF